MLTAILILLVLNLIAQILSGLISYVGASGVARLLQALRNPVVISMGESPTGFNLDEKAN